MKNTIIASLLGGIILFIWGFISWAVLPWHNAVSNKFTDEAAVAQVIKDNASQAGIYYLPFAEEDIKEGATAAFVNALPNGYTSSMGGMMAGGIIGNIISVFIVLLLLNQTSGLSYKQKVGFVALTGFAIGAIGQFPYLNWFNFPCAYTAVIVIDTVIGWTLAGLAFVKFSK